MNNTQEVPKQTHLVTMDVKSRYTNIPNPEDIAATEKLFHRQRDNRSVFFIKKLVTIFVTPFPDIK